MSQRLQSAYLVKYSCIDYVWPYLRDRESILINQIIDNHNIQLFDRSSWGEIRPSQENAAVLNCIDLKLPATIFRLNSEA